MGTTTDFTGCGPYLFAALLGLMCFGFMLWMLSLFGLYMPGAQKLYALLGAVLFSFYIIYDTQLIVGGRHRKCAFTIDDYCWAAMSIYLDIINLFLFLLEIVGQR